MDRLHAAKAASDTALQLALRTHATETAALNAAHDAAMQAMQQTISRQQMLQAQLTADLAQTTAERDATVARHTATIAQLDAERSTLTATLAQSQAYVACDPPLLCTPPPTLAAHPALPIRFFLRAVFGGHTVGITRAWCKTSRRICQRPPRLCLPRSPSWWRPRQRSQRRWPPPLRRMRVTATAWPPSSPTSAPSWPRRATASCSSSASTSPNLPLPPPPTTSSPGLSARPALTQAHKFR